MNHCINNLCFWFKILHSSWKFISLDNKLTTLFKIRLSLLENDFCQLKIQITYFLLKTDLFVWKLIYLVRTSCISKIGLTLWTINLLRWKFMVFVKNWTIWLKIYIFFSLKERQSKILAIFVENMLTSGYNLVPMGWIYQASEASTGVKFNNNTIFIEKISLFSSS